MQLQTLKALQLIPGGQIACTDFSSKKPHRQAGFGRVVAAGSIGGEMVSTLVQNARVVGSIPSLGTIIPIFITPHDNSQ